MIAHEHHWVESEMYKCPHCHDLVELCIVGNCKEYRCVANRKRFKLIVDRMGFSVLKEVA